MSNVRWAEFKFPPVNLYNVWPSVHMQPKDKVITENYKKFSHKECEFYPCHKIEDGEDQNCLFCYCPLAWLKCPGTYTIIESPKNILRKDCSQCTITHGNKGWEIVQHWLKNPIAWDQK